MTYEERQAYRKRKKLIRKIQVYSEIGAISLAIIIIGGLIISHITGPKDKLAVAAEEETSVSTEASAEEPNEESKGLKVSAKAAVDPDLAKEEEPEDMLKAMPAASADDNMVTASLVDDAMAAIGIK